MLQCKKCKSNNITVTAVAEQKKRGCLGACMWLVLSIITLGMLIWVPLIMRKGSKTKSYAICQDCGYRWKI